jgi:uncharacterized repeat protein (TIGR03803 family)
MLKRYFVVSILAAACCAWAAPVYKLIYYPPTLQYGEIITMSEVQPGLFYVLSVQGGSKISSVSTAGGFKSIYSFPTANNNSVATMVQGANGRIYGAAGGTTGYYYYSISASGTGFQQYSFPGELPSQWGSLHETVAAPPGQFYDLALAYISNTNVYGLAQIQETGTITILSQLTPAEGYPYTGTNIILGPGGNIYGIATGESNDHGLSFIFSFTPAGIYSRLATLPPPAGKGGGDMPLIGASDGSLYGTIPFGGTNSTGEIYQVTPSGELQIVANFPATGMKTPATLVQAADGNIYGSTNSNAAQESWIFRYSPSTKQLTQIYQLAGDQGLCFCFLQEGMDGKLYGVTPTGGPYPGAGVIWSLDIGLPKPPPQVQGLYPSSGAVGQQVILWGNYLLGATSVTFNGTPAPGAISTSKQSVLVSVPSGATTGPVTVTTANGSFTTTQNFTVQ